MSKSITSPVEHFPGSVTISDPLTYPQFLAVQDGVKEVERYLETGETLTQERMNYVYLPGLIGCVEKWKLDNFPEDVTADTFPGTPGVASGQLVAWLLSEIISLYTDADEVPED